MQPELQVPGNDLVGHGFAQACSIASMRARQRTTYVYVVYAGDGLYAAADEGDLDTWWLGATVHQTFGPDGSVCD